MNMARQIKYKFPSILLVLISILALSSLSQSQRESYFNFIVVSRQGNDTKSCLNKTSLVSASRDPCEKLDYVFDWISNHTKNNTKVVLEPGTYNLTKNATFENIVELGINGNESHLGVEILCLPDVGITFKRSGNIRIQNVTITGCGTLHHSTIGQDFKKYHKNHTLFYTGVFVAYCKNITIQNCRIHESRGIGLTMYDVGGELIIRKTKFIHNTPSMNISYAKDNNYALAGGGVYLELTFDGALPPFDHDDPERFTYQHNNQYLIEDCTFQDNKAPDQYFNETYIEFPSGEDHVPFGRGGGASIFVKGNATNNNITVSGSHFIYNTALWGAGFFIEFQDQTENNHFEICNSHFIKNNAITAGGGVRSGILIWKGSFLANTITHRRNVYDGNKALLGGGVSHCGPSYSLAKGEQTIREIVYKNCLFKYNQATVGAALGFSTGLLDLSLKSLNLEATFPWKVVVSNATIVGNRIIINAYDKKVIGQGALYTAGANVEFQESTKFDNNSDTALVLDNALMIVKDSVTFTNNTGLQGGAIGVYGLSIIDLQPGSTLKFIDNHASEKGGAIYVAANGPPVLDFKTTEINIRNCFLGYNGQNTVENVTHWKVSILFDSNTASKGGGNSLYAQSLQSCRQPGDSRNNSEIMRWKFVTYKNSHGAVNIGDEISTDPLEIEIFPQQWDVAPGEEFDVELNLYDEKNSLVQGIVKISLINEQNPAGCAQLAGLSPLLLINPQDRYSSKVSGLKLRGNCNCLFTLRLTTIGGQTIRKEIPNLRLKDCNMGYQLNNKTLECKCSKSVGVSTCDRYPDKKGKYVYLKNGYWGGIVGELFTTYPCPPGYCSKTVTDVTKTGDYKMHPGKLCATNRSQTSVLCGKCEKNCTVLIGSEECLNSDCGYNALYWFVPVLCLALTIFVLILLALDLDIFTVYLNAFLYAYQVIPLLLSQDNETFYQGDHFITFIIGLTNIRFDISKSYVCIKGLTALGKLAIEYSFPGFIFLLLLFLRFSRINSLLSKIPCCPRFRCLELKNNNKATHALCNLLVLCYTDIILTSFKIVHYIHLNGDSVLFFDGSIEFYKDWSKHLLATIFAIIFLCLTFALAVILMVVPQVCHRYFTCYQTVRVFFDHFQSCFEDVTRNNDGEDAVVRSHRWFAGFYLLCRYVMFLLSFYIPFGTLRRSVLEIACVVIASVCLFVKPYNKEHYWLNISDALLLLNLCLIAILSTALNYDFKYQKGLKIVVHVLIYIPFIYLAILFSFCCYVLIRRCMNSQNQQREEPRLISDEQNSHSPPNQSLT